MIFTDRIFFLLLTATLVLYYLRKSPIWQICVLLAASVIFYAFAQPWLLILLALSAALSSVTSYQIEIAGRTSAQRAWAIAGVTINLLVLIFFKYDHLLLTTFLPPRPENLMATLLRIPLPVGISFYTFHGISLVVDVFRARRDHDGKSPLGLERSFSDHAIRSFLYLTFFPQLIAGPIAKAKYFYPQISAKNWHDIRLYPVAKTLVTGFFLKSVVADNLAQQTFRLEPPYCYSHSALNLVILLLGYAIQIFADFAGYSLIAIGLARVFGYTLPENFCFPYISQTFSEFWTRWHMSLSSWLRDYVYYPLGGNRKGRYRTYLNLLLVMTLGGLWHGTGWSYAIWGLWHGVALAVERVFRDTWFYLSQAMWVKAIRWMLVFMVVSLGWLLFRLPNFQEVREVIGVAWHNRSGHFEFLVPYLIFAYSAPVIVYHLLYRFRDAPPRMGAFLWSSRSEGIILGVMLAAIILQSAPATPFIYFQF